MSNIRELMPVLSIRPRDGADPALTLRDLEVCIDGVPIKGLSDFTLTLSHDDINRAVLRINVSDVELDPEAVAVLEAHARVKVPA